MPPRISVLVPVYNVEKYLEQCLKSIQAQTFVDFELVAINDGSTDQSLQILQSYAKTDQRIRIISQKNEGLACVRNRLLEEAKGEYFIFVDSDDWISMDCLQVLYERAVSTNADIVQGWYKEYDEYSNSYKNCDELYRLYHGHKPPTSVKERFEAGRSYLQVWGRLTRLSVVATHNLHCLPHKLAEDTSLSLLLYQYANKIEFVEQYVAFYRRSNATSLTVQTRKMAFDIFAQWCYVTGEFYKRHLNSAVLYSCLLHLILRHCMTDYCPLNDTERAQMEEVIEVVNKYACFCTWPRRWKYGLFAWLVRGKSPTKISFWAKLLH